MSRALILCGIAATVAATAWLYKKYTCSFCGSVGHTQCDEFRAAMQRCSSKSCSSKSCSSKSYYRTSLLDTDDAGYRTAGLLPFFVTDDKMHFLVAREKHDDKMVYNFVRTAHVVQGVSAWFTASAALAVSADVQKFDDLMGTTNQRTAPEGVFWHAPSKFALFPVKFVAPNPQPSMTELAPVQMDALERHDLWHPDAVGMLKQILA